MSKFRQSAKKIAQHFAPKPWDSDIMEFRYGLWRGLSPLYTESGRQLGEENTRPFLFNDHVPAETLACKYEGSRYGKLINISALRTAMRHFDDALGMTSAVYRACLVDGGRIGRNAKPGIWDLYILSRASIAVIAFQMRKKDHTPTPAKVADIYASQYQFVTGIFMICRDMMNNADDLMAKNKPISAEALYAYADRREIFTSDNDMVCAGSKTKIMEFLSFCVDDAGKSLTELTAKTVSQSAYADIQNLVSDQQSWQFYSLATIEFDCFIEIEYLGRQIDLQPENRARLETISGIYRGLADHCIDNYGLAPRQSGLDFADGALERQNYILGLLGRDQLSKIPAKQLFERLNF